MIQFRDLPPLKPGTRIELSGAGGPNNGTFVYLRHAHGAAELLPTPLRFGDGLLLAAYWIAFQVKRFFRWIWRTW